jgi:hypothetical protein
LTGRLPGERWPAWFFPSACLRQRLQLRMALEAAAASALPAERMFVSLRRAQAQSDSC